MICPRRLVAADGSGAAPEAAKRRARRRRCRCTGAAVVSSRVGGCGGRSERRERWRAALASGWQEGRKRGGGQRGVGAGAVVRHQLAQRGPARGVVVQAQRQQQRRAELQRRQLQARHPRPHLRTADVDGLVPVGVRLLPVNGLPGIGTQPTSLGMSLWHADLLERDGFTRCKAQHTQSSDVGRSVDSPSGRRGLGRCGVVADDSTGMLPRRASPSLPPAHVSKGTRQLPGAEFAPGAAGRRRGWASRAAACTARGPRGANGPPAPPAAAAAAAAPRRPRPPPLHTHAHTCTQLPCCSARSLTRCEPSVPLRTAVIRRRSNPFRLEKACKNDRRGTIRAHRAWTAARAVAAGCASPGQVPARCWVAPRRTAAGAARPGSSKAPRAAALPLPLPLAGHLLRPICRCGRRPRRAPPGAAGSPGWRAREGGAGGPQWCGVLRAGRWTRMCSAVARAEETQSVSRAATDHAPDDRAPAPPAAAAAALASAWRASARALASTGCGVTLSLRAGACVTTSSAVAWLAAKRCWRLRPSSSSTIWASQALGRSAARMVMAWRCGAWMTVGIARLVRALKSKRSVLRCSTV